MPITVKYVVLLSHDAILNTVNTELKLCLMDK